MATSSGGGWYPRSSVDWYQLERELDSVPSDFRAARFDSLKHVVEVLGSVDPKETVEELKESKVRLQGLIDQVVDAYHNGFNVAIQNYSQILHLFTESRDQVDGLRLSLLDSRRRLGAQSRVLRQQWCRSVKLDFAVKIVDHVAEVLEVPAKIDGFQKQQDWPKAVNALIEGCGKLCQEELSKIHALRKVKDDLGARWRMLQSQICTEILRRVYETELTDIDAIGTSAKARPSHRRAGNLSSGQTPRHTRNVSLGSEKDSTSSLRGSSFTLRRRLSDAGELLASEVAVSFSIKDLVDCLAQMGSLQELKKELSRSMSAKIKGAIIQLIMSSEIGSETSREKGLGGPPGTPSISQGVSIPPEVSIAAQNLLESVCNLVYRTLHNVVRVFEIISHADDTGDSAAIQFIRTQIQEQQQFLTMRLSQISSATFGPPQEEEESVRTLNGGKYLDAACLEAWKCAQDEVLQLVAEILCIPLRQRNQGKSGSQNWLARLEAERSGKGRGKAGGDGERKSKMTFSFDLGLAGILPKDGPGANAGEKDMITYSHLCRQILNHPGGPYLSPPLYKVVVRFVDACQKVIHATLEKFEEGMAGQSQALQNSHNRLRDFVENFVMDSFVPQVWVDFRGRLTAALEDPEAFKPQTRTRSLTRKISPELLPGDSVLRAAHIAQKMVKEVSVWVPAVPPFASSLTGVIENILGRVLDAFTAKVTSVLGDFTSGGLASNPDIILLMSQETDAALIPDPATFYSLTSGDCLDVSISASPSPSPAPSSAESDLAENEIIKAILSENPTHVDNVMARPGHFGSMVQLATLCNSLDFIASSISGLVRRSELPSSPSMSTSDASGTRIKSKKTRQVSLGWSDGLSSSLALLINRYRALAGLCIRALRLEMMCLAAHHLFELTSISHLCEDNDRTEMPSCLGSLIRNAARAEEEIAPHLPSHKRKYVLSILPSACAKLCMYILPEVKEINSAGVERMVRLMSVLQPALSSFLAPTVGGTFRMFDHVRAYYSMLNLTMDDLLAYVGERPGRFSYTEWKALVEVHVPGRWVTDEQLQVMDKSLEARLQGLSYSAKRTRGAIWNGKG